LLKGYRLLLSPWLGSACRFEPTCSVYAMQAIDTHDALAGSYSMLVPRWPAVTPGVKAAPTRCRPASPGCSPVSFPLHSREVFMNDIRRTILWVVFGFSMVLLWDQWQVHTGHTGHLFPALAKCSGRSQVGCGRRALAGAGPIDHRNAAGRSPGGARCSRACRVAASAPAVPRERIVVTTDVLKLTFDAEGGSLVHTEFLKHIDMAGQVPDFASAR